MDKNDIKGIIFDYGGTIDTNGAHWAEVLWDEYEKHKIPAGKKEFRAAYIHGERTLAINPVIKPGHDFHDVLSIKAKMQMDYLAEKGNLVCSAEDLNKYAGNVADACYAYVLNTLKTTRKAVEELSNKYKLVLVTNFYGNINTVLEDFDLARFFSDVIESSTAGVRKPDPAIYALGVQAVGYDAGNVLAVGDSFSKDVVPAKKAGCKVAWLEGRGWGEENINKTLPDLLISDLAQLPAML